MFSNYFKIAWRNLLKSKGHSFINISGLSIGMAATMMIGLWVYDELSFNTYHRNYDRIGQIWQHTTYDSRIGSGKSLPIPLAAELRHTFPELFTALVMSSQPWSQILATSNDKLKETGLYMQPDGIALFSINIIYGNENALDDQHSILLSVTLAKKLFDDDPLGKTIRIDNKTEVIVTGVYEDFPNNSQFSKIHFICPWNQLISSYDWAKAKAGDWHNDFAHIFIQLAPGVSFEYASALIRDAKRRHVNEEMASHHPQLFLHPMRRWHLYSTFDNGVATSDLLEQIWFYGIIGVFILVLACINFMNLSTARSATRAKEVGIRKTVGSIRAQLVWQFVGESCLIAALAFVLSLAIVHFSLPWFNNLAGKRICIPWSDYWFWLCGIAFTLFTGAFAASYPAFYLSSFRPVAVLRGTMGVGHSASLPRKVMVVVQFTISIALIVGTLAVYKQIQLAKARPSGYSRDGLVVVSMSTDDFHGQYDVFRNELKHTGVVTEVALSGGSVTDIWSENRGFTWAGKAGEADPSFATLAVSYEYGKTVGWEFIDGRDFSREFASDSVAFVINEAAAKLMEQRGAGGSVKWETRWYRSGNYNIIGIVKDMVMRSPFAPATPTVFFVQPYWNTMLIKIDPRVSAGEALPKIEAVFKKLVPAVPFSYNFADDEYAMKFAAEERIEKLVFVFAALAVFISGLGLSGLASFLAERRSQEISIRKVLGASVTDVWALLSKDFIILIILSCVISIPVAYYFLDVWLQRYEYRTELYWWFFALAALGALLVTLLAVSFQALKAGQANPARSLRD